MAIDKPTIDGLLAQLNDYIDRIEEMDFPQSELKKNKLLQDALARRLQLALEICIDISMHLISGLNLPIKDTAVDAVKLLGQEKILDKSLAEKMVDAAKFRNLLVHGYAKIDYDHVAKNYKTDLNDIRAFAQAVVNFLEKNPQLIEQ